MSGGDRQPMRGRRARRTLIERLRHRPTTWRATLALMGVGVLVPALAYAVVANRFGFLGPRINLDLLAIYLVAVGIALVRPRLAMLFLVAGVTATLAVQIGIGIGAVYIDDPALIREYMAFVAFWPWRLISLWMAVAAVLLVALYLLLRRIDAARAKLWPAAALLVLLLGADLASHSAAGYTLMGENVATSGLQRAISLGRHWATSPGFSRRPIDTPMTVRDALAEAPRPARILSVSVEALGLARDPAFNAAVFGPMARILSARYAVEIGRHAAKGGTLSGELRELCNERTSGTPTRAIARQMRDGCLPRRLATAGYETLGIHGNSGFFYNRAQIYPIFGFGRTLFYEDFLKRTPVPPRCRTRAFEGVCDAAPFAAAIDFVGGGARRYAHVMTLDTHFPLGATALGGTSCARTPRAPSSDLCLYANQMSALLSGLARQLVASRVPPDAVYIFGDHPPPYIVASDRVFFDRGAVPYIRLRLR